MFVSVVLCSCHPLVWRLYCNVMNFKIISSIVNPLNVQLYYGAPFCNVLLQFIEEVSMDMTKGIDVCMDDHTYSTSVYSVKEQDGSCD